MIIKTSDFISGVFTQEIIEINFYESNNDYYETDIEICYRVGFGEFKLEASFFKKTNVLHYVQLEKICNGDVYKNIKIFDNINIFNKNLSWFRKNIRQYDSRIKFILNEDSKTALEGIFYVPSKTVG